MVHFSRNSLLYCGDNWPKAFEDYGGGRQVGSNGASFYDFILTHIPLVMTHLKAIS